MLVSCVGNHHSYLFRHNIHPQEQFKCVFLIFGLGNYMVPAVSQHFIVGYHCSVSHFYNIDNHDQSDLISDPRATNYCHQSYKAVPSHHTIVLRRNLSHALLKMCCTGVQQTVRKYGPKFIMIRRPRI